MKAHMPPFTTVDEQQDMVNSPPHYTQGDIECIDAIKEMLNEDQYRGYLRGTVIKYLWRLDYKKKPRQDSEKAQYYLNKLVEQLQESNE
jgi:hypothetical protein